MRKINPALLTLVNVFNASEEKINLIVYSSNLLWLENFLKSKGDIEITDKFQFISAIGIKAPVKVAIELEKFRNVKHITFSSHVTALIDKARSVVHVEEAEKLNLTGKGVTVAVIDTGVGEHFDLTFPRSKILHFENILTDDSTPCDDNGHGTFVCGLIAGNGLLSGGRLCGVAPGCNLVVVKALNEKGETSAINILKAMQWVHENRQKYNIKVCCMSFGAEPLGYGDPLVAGAEVLWRDGIVVVSAAGNSGPAEKTIKSPGTASRIVTVGALDYGENPSFETEYSVANFSSRGPGLYGFKPDCLAPGVKIKGLGSSAEKIYTEMSGTSMSAPIVAGLCALILEKRPNLKPDQVKMILLRSGKKYSNNRNDEGAGLVDAGRFNI